PARSQTTTVIRTRGSGFGGFANKGLVIMTHQPRTMPVIHRVLPITPSIGEGADGSGKPPRFELFLREGGGLCSFALTKDHTKEQRSENGYAGIRRTRFDTPAQGLGGR